MGARQSKRSVDITTATGALPESGGEAVAGKLGKLEDGAVAVEAASKQNGDAVLKEKERQLECGTPENEKDSSTEKGLLVPPAASDSAITPAAVENGLGDATPDGDMPVVGKSVVGEELQSPTSPSEDTSEVASPTSPTSPTSGDEKQTEKKKEKKKKWSFRSISFSKKDKQKPSKKQQPQEENGDIEKVPEEGGNDAAAAAAASEAPAGDVSSASCTKEEKTNENEPTKTEESVESRVLETLTEKATDEVLKTTIEEKCEKPICATTCEVVSEPVCKNKAPEPTLVKDTEPVEQAQPEVPAESVTSIVTAENKVQGPAQSEQDADVPVPENVEAKQDPEILPPPSSEDQKEVCDHTSPPPLPVSSPPSQISVFAETMLASETCPAPKSIISPATSDVPDRETINKESESSSQNVKYEAKLEESVGTQSDAKVSDKSELISQNESVPVVAQLETAPAAAQPESPLDVQPEPVASVIQPELMVAMNEPGPATAVNNSESVTVVVQSEPVAPIVQPESLAADNNPEPVAAFNKHESEATIVQPEPLAAVIQLEVAPVDVQSTKTQFEEIPAIAEPKIVWSEATSTVPSSDGAPVTTQNESEPTVPQSGVPCAVINKTEVSELEHIDQLEHAKNNEVCETNNLESSDTCNINEDLHSSVEKKDADLTSPPSSPPSVQEVQLNSDSITTKTESSDNLPSPPPSPLSAQDTSISESVAVNTITEDQLPSPPQSPEIFNRDATVSNSRLQLKTALNGSFDELAPLPPPPTAENPITDDNEINNGLQEKLPAQQEKSNDEVAELSTTESTLNDSVTKEITEKVAGLVLMDDVPPVEISLPTESAVTITEN